MDFVRIRLASALLLTLLASPVPIPAQQAAREVERLERDLVAAIGRGDLATYDRIVADDYVAFEASGKTSPKAEIVASYRSGARKYTDLTIFDVEARVFGDTAVVTAKTKGFRREGDRDVPNRVRYIRVYAKRKGEWRAVAQMAAPLPPDEAPKASTPRNGAAERPGLVLLSLVPEDPAARQKREQIEAHEKEMAAVWVTTDRRVVEGCTKLGGVGIHDDNSLDLVRRNAAQRGADVIRLRELKEDAIWGDIYRCAEWDPLNLPTPTPTPTDQQRASKKSFEAMKARVRVIGDPSLVSECEKVGGRPANLLDDGEDLLRGSAVASRANVLVLRRFEGAQILGEFFRCSPAQIEALPSPTPGSRPTPTP